MNPSQQPKESIASEKAEILKATQGFKYNQFQNAGNNVFARTQSTPLEDQKPAGLSLKERMAQKKKTQAAEFKPSADSSSAANEFLKITSSKLSSNAQAFTPENYQPKTEVTATKTVAETTTTTTTATTTTPVTTGTTTTPATSTTGTTAAAGGAEKKRLKLSSTSFPFQSATTTKPVVTEERKTEKNEKNDKLALSTDKINKPTPKKAPLEDIPEKNEENKKEVPVNTYIKPNQGFEPPKPSNEFQEVKSKSKGLKAAETKTQPVQSPGIQTKPKEQESPKKPEAKPVVQEPKVEEKPVAPVKKEVKIEIVVMSRDAFADALEKLLPSLRERRLPENLLAYQNRDIMNEQKGKGRGGGQYDNKNQGSTGGGFDRSQKVQQPEPQKEKTEEGGYQRGSLFKPSTPAEPKFSIGRVGLTPEELEMKKKLSENVNVWTSAMKGEKDPEGAFRKDVKFNLNVLTIDNFDVIKVKILKLANLGPEQCKKVAELIIENAWTQKRYVNTYAKLCKFLGEQDSLSFEAPSDSKKKKNDFTLQILKQIQHVFEDDSNAKVTIKKPVEEMDAEEKSEYLAKKKQKIFGNVSFIGELFLEKVIVIGVVRIITLNLLSKFLEEYNTFKKSTEASPNKFYEDTLEGLLRFYEIVGKAIEDKETSQRDTKTKKKGEKAAEKPSNIEGEFANNIKAINGGNPAPENLRVEGEISLDGLFKILNTVLTETGLTPRLDSLVKNLIYRRDNNWQDSIAKDQGPKTMRELHEEYQREQMAAELSGAQYKEELRYSQTSKSNKVYTPKNEFQFQVANDTRERKDDRREIENLDNVDTSKYSFKPDRSSKKDTGDSKSKPKVNYEIIKGDLKDIYKLTNGEEVEEKKDAIEELKKLSDKYEAKDVLISFLKTFYDGSLSSIQKRFVVSTWLFENKPQALTEFPTLLSNALNDLFRELSDFPNLPKYLARIALDYCRVQKNGDILKRINLSESIAKSEEGYDLADMFEKFNDQFLSFLNGEYSDLKNIIAEDILKDFAKKIQIDFE